MSTMTQRRIVTTLVATLVAGAGVAALAADPVKNHEQNQVRIEEQNQVRQQAGTAEGAGQQNRTQKKVRQRNQEHVEHRMGNGPGGDGGMGRGTPRR